MSELVLWVPGVPQPQGSTRAFRTKRGKVVTTSANLNLKPWRQMITLLAQSNARRSLLGLAPEASVEVEVHFVFARPRAHFGVKGNVLPSARAGHVVKPDLDKLCRAVLDGLTEAGIFHDDAQVVRIVATKDYTTTAPGAAITVREATSLSQPVATPGVTAHGSHPAGLRRAVG